MKTNPFITWSDAILELAIDSAVRGGRTDSDWFRSMQSELDQRFAEA